MKTKNGWITDTTSFTAVGEGVSDGFGCGGQATGDIIVGVEVIDGLIDNGVEG